jgi:NAD(P)-dependent dehydrogenase (short-subunit alcohol dehydrogenase family)
VSKRVLITGADGGIGYAAAAALRERGARVVGLDLEASGPDAVAADVRDQEAVDAAVGAAVDRLGGLDVLINNAGIGAVQDTGTTPSDRTLAVIDVNLVGPWRVTAAAMPALIESRGRVVNVASGLAHVTLPFAAAYCMSKRGLVAFSDALRLEYGGAITVTTVYPGYIRTPIHDIGTEVGVSLEGVVPPERVEDAARTLARAALDRPVRDLATTRRGTLSYALARRAPRGLLLGLVDRTMRRHARNGSLAGSDLAAGYLSRSAKVGAAEGWAGKG